MYRHRQQTNNFVRSKGLIYYAFRVTLLFDKWEQTRANSNLIHFGIKWFQYTEEN